MKLEEAILGVKRWTSAIQPDEDDCECLFCASRRLVAAVEEHLKEERERTHAMRAVCPTS